MLTERNSNARTHAMGLLTTLAVGVALLAVGMGAPLPAQASSAPFVSTWDTRIVTPTSSAANQIRLPLVDGGDYNFTVSWGDGTTSQVTSPTDSDRGHTFAAPGV